MTKLVIIIPALNEETTIKSVVERCTPFADVIVVNDGSTDNTSEIAKKSGAKVIDLTENTGVDGATFAGLEHAYREGYSFAITLDADGQHDPELLNKFSEPLIAGTVVMVHGIRPSSARISEKIMRLYSYHVYGISDILCGFKGYSLAHVYAPNIKMRRYKTYSTSLPWCVINDGLTFSEVDISVKPRDLNDTPRIGGLIKANIRILSALAILLLFDLRSLLNNPRKFIRTRLFKKGGGKAC